MINHDYILACNEYEREAAYFYKKNGYDVILKLDHIAIQVESYDEVSRALNTSLRRYMPKIEYEKFMFKTDQVKKSLNLNEVYPEHYSLSFYPPDFIVFNSKSGDWKFVEVKSPTDKLHFRQANWYINLMPDHWKYELFCSINKDIEDIYIKNDLPKKGGAFDSIYLQHVNDTDKWNKESNLKVDPIELERRRKEYLQKIQDRTTMKNK